MKTIILLGRQGSGKGTQAKLLVAEFDFHYIGSGELLRSFYNGEGFSAKKTKQVLNAGGYVPTPIIFRLWMDRLEGFKDTRKPQGIIFDGSPRKILEAHLLDQALSWYEWDKELSIVLIDISRKEAQDRLTKRRICAQCGNVFPWVGEFKKLKVCDNCGVQLITRPDDTPEAIKGRLDLFETQTMEVITYYKKQQCLKIVNGEQSIEKVYEDLKAVISK